MPGGLRSRPANQLPAGYVSVTTSPPYSDHPIEEYWGPVVAENESHIRIAVGDDGDTITLPKKQTTITRSVADQTKGI